MIAKRFKLLFYFYQDTSFPTLKLWFFWHPLIPSYSSNTDLTVYTLCGFPSCKQISPSPMLRDLGTHGVRMITEITVDSVCADCSCYNCHIVCSRQPTPSYHPSSHRPLSPRRQMHHHLIIMSPYHNVKLKHYNFDSSSHHPNLTPPEPRPAKGIIILSSCHIIMSCPRVRWNIIIFIARLINPTNLPPPPAQLDLIAHRSNALSSYHLTIS